LIHQVNNRRDRYPFFQELARHIHLPVRPHGVVAFDKLLPDGGQLIFAGAGLIPRDIELQQRFQHGGIGVSIGGRLLKDGPATLGRQQFPEAGGVRRNPTGEFGFDLAVFEGERSLQLRQSFVIQTD
jgi:hypothetical protein